MVNVKDILKKHSARIEEQIESTNLSDVGFSQEYVKFKQEMAPELSRYERWCRSLGNVVKLSVAEKDKESIRRQLEIAHVDVEPWQALTLSVMTFIGMFALGLFISIAIALIKGVGNGVPPEVVFGKVAESSRGLNIEDFFRRINYNIRNTGMSVEKAKWVTFLANDREYRIECYTTEDLYTAHEEIFDYVIASFLID